MDIDRQQIEERRGVLLAALRDAQARVSALQVAVGECDHWLRELDDAQARVEASDPPDLQVVEGGASEDP